MSTLSYEQSKSIALKTILLLAVITVVEVLIALIGKGHLINSHDYTTTMVGAAVMGLAMIALSFYKAIRIIFEFMHMQYEISGLAKSVLLPTLLLVWAIIAFLWEGSWWQQLRDKINVKNQSSLQIDYTPGYTFDAAIEFDEDVYIL